MASVSISCPSCSATDGVVRIRQQCRLPDATLARLIRPTNSRTLRRPDKAFTPHPATVPDA
ncbi:hypothetical protein FHB02_20235 [Escherichia coli]|uniref:IS1 family transposase n=1 Tax=Escherichia coli TaxID=562 RepID=UPI001C706195|nr:hypothetical protein [Escherichia coli]